MTPKRTLLICQVHALWRHARGRERAAKKKTSPEKILYRERNRCLHEKEGLVQLFSSSPLFLSFPCLNLGTDVAHLPSLMTSKVHARLAFSWHSFQMSNAFSTASLALVSSAFNCRSPSLPPQSLIAQVVHSFVLIAAPFSLSFYLFWSSMCCCSECRFLFDSSVSSVLRNSLMSSSHLFFFSNTRM